MRKASTRNSKMDCSVTDANVPILGMLRHVVEQDCIRQGTELNAESVAEQSFALQVVDLLSLPEEVLQNVAQHFTLGEWVQGPAQACRLLHQMKLTRVDLTCCKVQGDERTYEALAKISKQISYALACADRHSGPCTTSITIYTEAVQDGVMNFLGRSQASPSPCILPNVVSLELVLNYKGGSDDDNVRQLARWLLQRLPNLVAAVIYYPMASGATLLPLLRLKHLDLSMQNRDLLEGMSFSALVPELESACISVDSVEGGPVSGLDFSGCQKLARLVIVDLPVLCLSTPPQCRLRVDMFSSNADIYEDASLAQQGLPHLKEVFLFAEELCPPGGLLTRVCLPELEVVRCDWPDSVCTEESDELDMLSHCSRHSRNVPALKSILCGDRRTADNRPAVKARIPAALAGVQEIMLATQRPLVLSFDSARSAGERLDTFCVVASEVRVDAAALLDMTEALVRRGLILSVAQAGPEHEHAPSQCMYVRAISAPQLSYDDVIQCVNMRMGSWARHEGCGVCYKCLRRAGIVN